MIVNTKISVRDTDKNTDTAIALPAAGGELDLSQLPQNWGLDLRLCGSAIDGSPINWPIGKHTISVSVDAQAAQVINLTVAQSPTAVPTVQTPSVLGSNGEGITALSGDPGLHPQLLATCKALNFQYFRLWTQGDFKTPFTADDWKIPLKWAAAGVKILAVVNFQNSPKCATPADADWLMKINSFPPANESGVWGVCLGSECDTSPYYAGTTAQLVHLVQLAYPILKSKGYVVIAPSFILSLQNVREFVSAMGTNLAFDYLDYHVYAAGAELALSQFDGYQAYCATIGKPGMVSECGIRGTAGNASKWAAQITEMFDGLKSRTGIYLQFPLFWLPGSTDPLCQMAPLGRDSASPNEPFASAWKAVVGE